MKNHQIKCEHCEDWVRAKQETCESCGKTLRAREKSEALRKGKLRDPLRPQLISISEFDAPFIKVGKHVIRVGQIILYAFISFMVWMTTWTVG